MKYVYIIQFEEKIKHNVKKLIRPFLNSWCLQQ